MARSDTEIEKILQEHAEKSKGVALDINGDQATYQESSQIKSPEIPWWARLHLRAYGVNVKSEAASPAEKPQK